MTSTSNEEGESEVQVTGDSSQAWQFIKKQGRLHSARSGEPWERPSTGNCANKGCSTPELNDLGKMSAQRAFHILDCGTGRRRTKESALAGRRDVLCSCFLCMETSPTYVQHLETSFMLSIFVHTLHLFLIQFTDYLVKVL